MPANERCKMKIINATGLDFKELNEEIRKTDEAEIIGLEGQRYIGAERKVKNFIFAVFRVTDSALL